MSVRTLPELYMSDINTNTLIKYGSQLFLEGPPVPDTDFYMRLLEPLSEIASEICSVMPAYRSRAIKRKIKNIKNRYRRRVAEFNDQAARLFRRKKSRLKARVSLERFLTHTVWLVVPLGYKQHIDGCYPSALVPLYSGTESSLSCVPPDNFSAGRRAFAKADRLGWYSLAMYYYYRFNKFISGVLLWPAGDVWITWEYDYPYFTGPRLVVNLPSQRDIVTIFREKEKQKKARRKWDVTEDYVRDLIVRKVNYYRIGYRYLIRDFHYRVFCGHRVIPDFFQIDFKSVASDNARVFDLFMKNLERMERFFPDDLSRFFLPVK